ncbi:MAG: hypothetical protein ACT4QG_08955 [Sporichthyaceae bacterium]
MSIGPGDVGGLVQTSLCAGGLLRTWSDTGETRLWRLPDAATFAQMQGIGVVGRTVREDRRFREAAILYEERHTLVVQAREPVRAEDGSVSVPSRLFELEPADSPDESLYADVHTLLGRAVQHAVESGEYLLVELGGWDVPEEPFCLFVLGTDDKGPVSILEAAPQPLDSEPWAQHAVAGEAGVTLRAPANPRTLDIVPMLIMEAVSTWGKDPWDLALTFGERPPAPDAG